MEFPKSYFEDEVRDGFYVSALMKRAWAAQLEILEDIDRVCTKHNIEYFAIAGTLLGAIRHGGFIPWDDDLDICMKREDYDKFSRVAQEELQEFYVVNNIDHCNEKEHCEFYITRIYNGKSIRTDLDHMKKFHGFPYVVGVDIFPLDYLPKEEQEAQALREELVMLSTFMEKVSKLHKEELEIRLKKIEQTYHMQLDRKKSITYQLHVLADQLGKRFQAKDAKHVVDIPTYITTGNKLPKSIFDKTVKVPFENIMIPAPIGYAEFLQLHYGDYMKTVKCGSTHGYPFFDKQRLVYEANHAPLFKTYSFDIKDISGEPRVSNDGKTLKEIAGNMVALFSKMHQVMVDLMEVGDFEQVLSLLENCQESAIALGTKIEAVKGEGHATVAVLEKYCEVLYTIHEAILGNVEMDVQTAIDLLVDHLAAIGESVQKEIVDKKTAVFLPFKASAWDTLERAWKKIEEDKAYDVYVVPIPYYDRNVMGPVEDLHYEGENYPDDVPVYDYQTFDLECMHPDVIFIQNPYDEYNISTSVQPFFYARNLKNHTEQLVYIPYFVLDEIALTDGCAMESTKYFVTTPGVVLADTVIVQSEAMREVYVNKLVEFGGEKTKSIWERKIKLHSEITI